MINIIKKKVRKFLYRNIHTTNFFSQGGEDAILFGIFNKKIKKGELGFYLDIGAFHPYIHSNTFLFYINSWRGINMDACPGSMDLFNKLRPRDINLEIGIGNNKYDSTFYMLDEKSTMNSFSKENLTRHGVEQFVKKEVNIKMKTLEQILDDHSNYFTEIDFMSIDVEGMDYEVLKSNNWGKYKPKVIVVEINCSDIEDVKKDKSSKYLLDLGYKIVAKNLIEKDLASVFFVLIEYEY